MPQSIDEAMTLAQTLADSTMVPKAFQGKPQDILLCIIDALTRGRNPILHLQSRYVIQGQAAITGKGLIAEANASGRFKGCLKFKYDGQGADLAVTCWAIERETDERLEYTFSMADAKLAGYTSNRKYQELPREMLTYRAATFFARFYAPDIIQGMLVEGESFTERPTRGHVVDRGSDPLARLMAPLAAPDATGEAIKDAIHDEAKTQPAPQYAPAKNVDKLVARFEALGVPRSEVEDSFGPLDAMSATTFAEAIEYGKQKAAEAEPETNADPAPTVDPEKAAAARAKAVAKVRSELERIQLPEAVIECHLQRKLDEVTREDLGKIKAVIDGIDAGKEPQDVLGERAIELYLGHSDTYLTVDSPSGGGTMFSSDRDSAGGYDND
jgi:hypothetical protein